MHFIGKLFNFNLLHLLDFFNLINFKLFSFNLLELLALFDLLELLIELLAYACQTIKKKLFTYKYPMQIFSDSTDPVLLHTKKKN